MTDEELAKQTDRVTKANQLNSVLSRLDTAIGEISEAKKNIKIDLNFGGLQVDDKGTLLTNDQFPKLQARLTALLIGEIKKEIEERKKEFDKI